MEVNEGAVRCASRSPSGTHPMLLAGEGGDSHFYLGDDPPEDAWIFRDLHVLVAEHGGSALDEERIESEILTILDLAVEGQLSYSSVRSHKKAVSPVRRNNNLLEVRLPKYIIINKAKFRGRMYVCEPIGTLYDGIVVLLFHVKQDHNQELMDRQNDYIDKAADRLTITMRRQSQP